MSRKPAEVFTKQFFRIGEVARIVGVSTSVLRFWEKQFSWIKPERSSSGHRLYSRKNVEDFLIIKELLYEQRLTIEGARKFLLNARREGNIEELRKRHQAHLDEEDALMVLRKVRNDLKSILDWLK